MNTLQELAVGDAGGREERVVSADEVVSAQHSVEVVPLLDGSLALRVVSGPEAPLNLTIHALEGGGGDHPFGCATDAEEDVDVEVGPGRGNGTEYVAVGNEARPRAGGPHFGDQVGVPVAVEDDSGEILHVAPQRLRNSAEVFGGRARDVYGTGGLGPDGDLLHVHAGPGVEHGVPLTHGDDRHGVGAPERRRRRTVNGVDGDVD